MYDPTDANLIPSPSPPSKREKTVALLLILFCLLTTLGNLLYGFRQKEVKASQKDTTIKNMLFTDQADIGIISIEGTIMHGTDDPFASKDAHSDRIIRQIHQAENDKVKGLLLKINSPGGTAAASQSIYEQLMRIRKEGNIKVVSSMGDVAASGGYYIASASDVIVANPATLTGSIGVIAQFANFEGLFHKIGVSATVLKSGKHKDMGSPFRQPSTEDKKILQAIIDNTYQQFIEAVSKGRKLDIKIVRTLADGRVYTGQQAMKHKLVDKMGDYGDALDVLKKLTNVQKKPQIKNYSKPSLDDFFSILGTMTHGAGGSSLDSLTQSEWLRLNKIPLMLYL